MTSTEVDDDNLFIKRIPISIDGLLDAYPVTTCITLSMDHHKFDTTFRNKKPLIISGLAKNWLGLNGSSGAIVRILESIEECEVDVLVALDGRNFLKHDLCSTKSLDLREAVQKILLVDAKIHGMKVKKDASSCLVMVPQCDMERNYLRIYFDYHQNLRKEIDLKYLTMLMSSVPTSIHLVDELSPSCGNTTVDDRTWKTVGLWISSEGSVTPLHFDLCHGFLAQIVGRKTFLLASSEDFVLMRYWKSKCSDLNQNNGTTSPINMALWLEGDEKERSKHGNVDEVAWFIATLGPGDVLYTPPGWWHYVVSNTSSVSVLIPFDPLPLTEVLPTNVQTA